MAGGRLLLFYDLNNQTDYTDKDKAKLKQLTVCNHIDHPLPKEDRGKKCHPLKMGDNRLRIYDSARFLLGTGFIVSDVRNNVN